MLGLCLLSFWLGLGGVSIHSKPGYNGQNPGLSIQHDIGPKTFLAGGFYRNSERSISHFLVAGRRLASYKAFSGGFVAGMVDGYWNRNEGRMDILLAPYASWEGDTLGADLILIPPAEKHGAAALAIRVKVRLFE